MVGIIRPGSRLIKLLRILGELFVSGAKRRRRGAERSEHAPSHDPSVRA